MAIVICEPLACKHGLAPHGMTSSAIYGAVAVTRAYAKFWWLLFMRHAWLTSSTDARILTISCFTTPTTAWLSVTCLCNFCVSALNIKISKFENISKFIGCNSLQNFEICNSEALIVVNVQHQLMTNKYPVYNKYVRLRKWLKAGPPLVDSLWFIRRLLFGKNI